jgi:hypothetical protein
MIKLINLLKEADVRTLRRVVILALFTSDIPNQMEAAFKKRVSSNPDTDVIKANKKFLEQLLEDKASLMNDPNYQELKKDPDFLRLSRSVTDTLNNLNKAGDLDFGNIAYAKPVLGRNKLSYSTVLYVAAEDQVKNLENYLTREYGEGFVFKLLRTKEMGIKTVTDPTTPSQPLDELSGDEYRDKYMNLGYKVSNFDREAKTRFAYSYKLPDENSIKRAILSNNDQDKIDALEEVLKGNKELLNIPSLNNIQDAEDAEFILTGIIKQVPIGDIKNFNQREDKIDKILNISEHIGITIPYGWIPSDNNLKKIENIKVNVMAEAKQFFKLIM